MQIGLSYHGGDADYEDYPAALHRRARTLGLKIDTLWLAGAKSETRLDLLARLDAIVFTGGPDVEPQRYGFADSHGHCRTNPERDAVEWEMLEGFQRRPVPVLAICRGAQLLNVFNGGSLIPDLGERNATHRRSGDERREHPVAIAPGSRLHALTGLTSGRINSSHHQAVDRLAQGFRVSAISDDGVIEAFEPADPGEGPFALAVQWHPEGMQAGEPLADRVLDALLSSAKH
jgi:putative glutamine amidotransferase